MPSRDIATATTLQPAPPLRAPACRLPGAPLLPTHLDHLVYATPRLEETLQWFEAETGVRPLPGGTHPAWRTRNAIIPLSTSTYLELIGPDTAAPGASPSLFRIDTLEAPRLITWAAKGTALPAFTREARASGIELGAPSAGSRQRPDGSRLAWELTDPFALPADGLLPFFIDWGISPHPATGAPAEVELTEFHAEHPDPASIQALLGLLGQDLAVQPGPTSRLVAIFSTPRGQITLS